MEQAGAAQMTGWSRRRVLAGLATLGPAAAFADPMDVSRRPALRPEDWPPTWRPPARPELTEFVARHAPDGHHTVSLVDMQSGRQVEALNATDQLPPASVTKTLTAFYGLQVLGPNYRFVTRILTNGPMVGGTLQGDLILMGGGDPDLRTDDLAQLAKQVRASGITRVDGRLLLWAGALPHVVEIEPNQDDHFAYNPSVGGLNLNYNRVYFSWRRTGGSYDLTLNAATERYRPEVSMASIRSVQRDLPVFAYEHGPEHDEWTVAQGALGADGARWLPVRFPALYTGDVFKTMLQAEGVSIGQIARSETEPTGNEVTRIEGQSLLEVARNCLKYSTNLTAEVIGLTASSDLAARPEALTGSAARMSGFVKSVAPSRLTCVDHSGLSDMNRISADELTAFLRGPDVYDTLAPILREHPLVDADGNQVSPIQPVLAKTGSLDFVSTLAGYFTTRSGRRCAFAIQSADLMSREIAKQSVDDTPAGARTWATQARRLQQKLLQRWVLG